VSHQRHRAEPSYPSSARSCREGLVRQCARGCKVADSDLMRLAIRVCNSICWSNASAARPPAVHPRASCKYELFAGAVLPRWYCPPTGPTNRSSLTPSGPNSLINRVSIRECFVRAVPYNFCAPLPPSSATIADEISPGCASPDPFTHH